MNTPKTPQRIAGVLCSVELDEHGFIDVSIVGEEIPPDLSEEERDRRLDSGEILLTEWIVRGATFEEEAIQAAEKVIAVRRKGLPVRHDLEGRILPYIPGEGDTGEVI